MHYVFVGFTPETGSRVFRFERVGGDMSRTGFTVRADLALTRRYGIQMQDLPLLCNTLLSALEDNEERRDFTYGEEAMRRLADDKTAEKDRVKRKNAARKAPSNNGAKGPWHGPSSLGATATAAAGASASAEAKVAQLPGSFDIRVGKGISYPN